MAQITTRAGKGTPLTNDEVDANFVNLNDDKLETSIVSPLGDGLLRAVAPSVSRGLLDVDQAGTAVTMAIALG